MLKSVLPSESKQVKSKDVIGVSGGYTTIIQKESPKGAPSTTEFGDLHISESGVE